MSKEKSKLLDPRATASLVELKTLLRYFFLAGGPRPVLIGGWAVYLYNNYQGSIDIDVLGDSYGGEFDDIITRYEQDFKYTKIALNFVGLSVTRVKELHGPDGEFLGTIEVDAATFDRRNTFHEDETKEIPYSLCENRNYVTHFEFEPKADCDVPIKSLLLLYKLKALRDRAFDIRTKGATMTEETLNWMTAKFEKDKTDVIALFDPAPRRTIKGTIDGGLLRSLISEFKLEFALESLYDLPNDKSVIAKYGRLNRKRLASLISELKL